MSAEDQLLAAVRRAEAGDSPDHVDTARAAYLEVNPQGAESAEVRYRHGLSRLFRHKDADGALVLFRDAAQEKSATCAGDARVSYALLLLSKNKRQQAIFELKKVVPDNAAATPQTASALDFLTMMLRDAQAKVDEIARYEDMRRAHLKSLVDDATSPSEKAHWLLRLGAAFADGEGTADMTKARNAFSDVVKMGGSAGDSAVQSAKAALKSLPR
jgi:hypothetical protein